jgi:hypothetical protein
MPNRHPGLVRCPQQRIQHRPRSIRRRKQLARLLPLELHAQLTEEPDGSFDIESPDHLPNRVRRPARVRIARQAVMRHVAPPATRDEDLGPELPRAVQRHDAQWRPRITGRATRRDRRHQAGRAGADHRNVIRRFIRHARSIAIPYAAVPFTRP